MHRIRVKTRGEGETGIWIDDERMDGVISVETGTMRGSELIQVRLTLYAEEVILEPAEISIDQVSLDGGVSASR